MKNIFYKIFIIAYSSIFLINEFFTIDRLGPQTIALSILNFICLIFLTSRAEKSFNFSEFRLKFNSITSHYLIIFSSMIIFSFSAINSSEAVITLNHYFILIISFYCMLQLMKRIENLQEFILNTTLIFLFLESGYIFYRILEYNYLYDLWFGGFGRTFYIRGFTGNINISAFSIAYKLPFLCYGFFKEKNILFRTIASIFLIISIIDIFHLGSRGAILALIITIIIFSIISVFSFGKKSVIFLLILCSFGSGVSYLSLRNSVNLNPIERTKSISLNTTDGSVDSRLRYYKEVLEYLFDNSFKPIGVGMYKIYSVEFEKEHITDYRVPYHAHNDFLEILIENGILAFLSYTMIFILLIWESVKKYIIQKSIIHISILCFLLTYLLDSSLNFPITRPVSFLFFNLISAFTVTLKSKKS